jgi:hypothetical protein
MDVALKKAVKQLRQAANNLRDDDRPWYALTERAMAHVCLSFANMAEFGEAYRSQLLGYLNELREAVEMAEENRKRIAAGLEPEFPKPQTPLP